MESLVFSAKSFKQWLLRKEQLNGWNPIARLYTIYTQSACFWPTGCCSWTAKQFPQFCRSVRQVFSGLTFEACWVTSSPNDKVQASLTGRNMSEHHSHVGVVNWNNASHTQTRHMGLPCRTAFKTARGGARGVCLGRQSYSSPISRVWDI